MATVNRYTQINRPRYTPRTLQELMMVPAYKREQHDTINTSIAQLETQLAQYDSLDVHDDRLKAEQQKLYDQLTSQASKLESEGFSQSSKSDFLRFNKTYQQSIGPQGDIGKIQSAKASYEAEKAALMANAVQQGYGADIVKEKLREKYEKYGLDFTTDGKIVDFEAPLPPQYHDLETDILEFGKSLGYTEREWLANGEVTLTPDESGLIQIHTKTGSKLSKKNLEQLQSAVDALTSKWLKKGAPGDMSAGWQNMDTEYITDMLTNGMAMQKVDSYRDMRKEDFNFVSPPKKDEEEVEPPAYKLAITGGKQADHNLANADYTNIEGKIAELNNKGDEMMTPKEKAELAELEHFKTEVDKSLSKIDTYTYVQKQLPILEKEYYDAYANPEVFYKDDLQYQALLKEDVGKGDAEKRAGRYARQKTLAMKEHIEYYRGLAEDYREKVIESKRVLESTYTLLPEGSTARGDFKGFSSNLKQLNFSSPSEFSEAANIGSVVLGDKVRRNLTKDDKAGLARLLWTAKEFQFVDVTPSDLDGMPGYTIRVNKSDLTESYDLDGLSWANDDIGPGDSDELLQIHFNFTDPTSQGVRNVNTYVMEEINKSDDGPALIHEMSVQLAKKAFEGQTWESVIEGGHLSGDDSDPLVEAYQDALLFAGWTPELKGDDLAEVIKKVKKSRVYAY